MSPVPDLAVLPDVRPHDPSRAVVVAAAAVAALAGVTAAVGGVAALLPSLLAAVLYVAVQVTVLTVPALVVLHALVGSRTTLPETTGALARGVEDGGALLLALVPLRLFFGSSVQDPYLALDALFFVAQAAVLAGLVRARAALLDLDPTLSLGGRLAVTAWAGSVLLVALPAGLFAFRASLRVLA